ncbi:MAG: carbohydrate ABC transporter permease [bacterium]|nr:carbohydrate ABC transporter permease [bacterium]
MNANNHLKIKKKIKRFFITLLILFVVFVDIYPLFWMITASLKQPSEFVTKAAYALNSGFYFQNYIDAWTKGNMSLFFRNSLMNTCVSIVFITMITVTMSFALVKMDWKLRKIADQYIAFGIMVPFTTAMIPLFQIFSKMHLIDTRTCLILIYVSTSVSFSVFLTSGYMRSLSDEILEAAVIDGCGIHGLLFRIVIPLIKNAIITNVVIQFFFKWNDLLAAMTFVSSKRLKTVQTGLLYFTDEFGTKNWGAIFASVSICVIPMLIMYLFLNKRVIEGMTAGATKG